MGYLLKTNGLTKKYKESYAVSSANLTLDEGCIYGLIGKNGAGKTTILKLISGLVKPTAGTIQINEAICTMAEIGVLIENPGLYTNFTAFDNIKSKALCIGKKCNDRELNDLLELVGLQHVGNKKVKNFSLGMKQRLGIALALVGNPKLLILDEPINGLDPQGIIEVRTLIKKLNEEKKMTIIVSSHILDELAKIATDICIIHNGNILLEMKKEKFLEASGDIPIDEYYIKLVEGR